MVKIDVKTSLERFRAFIIDNTCASFMPRGYQSDPLIFPERDSSQGIVHVEAASKVELSRMREIVFVKVADVLGVIYRSKSGNTSLKWRQIRGGYGRVTGEASANSVVNLIDAGVLSRDYVKHILEEAKAKADLATTTATDNEDNEAGDVDARGAETAPA